MIGAPPSAGGAGAARPPRERNFYKKTNRNSKLLFFNPIERNIMEKIKYVERMSIATYPYDWNFYDEPEDLESPSVIYEEALEEHGKVFADQIWDVDKGHWPKVYGKDKREVEWGHDYISSYWKSPMRIRKDGKAHLQDIKSRKSFLRGRGFKKS